MTKSKRLLCIVMSLVFVFSLLPRLTFTASAIARNEVAGPRKAGDLTSYIYGDFVTEGELPAPFGQTNPWSAFDWLTDGQTITLAYSGPRVSTANTDFAGMGEYGYLGSHSLPSGAGMGDLTTILFEKADKDVRIYYFNLTGQDVNVSFHIQSTSKASFTAHSVAAVVTPDGITALDNIDPENLDQQNLSADLSFTLSPYTGTAPETYSGDNGDQESKRPADAPGTGFAPAGCFYISLTTQPQLGNASSAGVVISNFFAGGESDTLTDITLQAPSHGSYTATAVVPDGEGTTTVTETVTAGGENKSFSYLPANGFTLSATGDEDYNFDYWSNAGNAISYDAEFSTRAYGSGSTVVANFLPKAQTRAFEVGGTRYISWTQAVQAAKSAGATITLVKDYTFATTTAELAAKGDSLETGILENGDGLNYIVPAGVKFLVPYNAQDAGSFADGPGFSVADPGSAYRTLTVPSGVTLSVNGKLNVNSCAYASNATSFMGGAAGDYGFISLDGMLNVESGGELRTYGYIAGSGCVNVKPGGTSYEVLQITDWGGGSNAMSWNSKVGENDKKLEKAFYFSQYYVQNVEAKYRVYSGATASVYGHLTASMGDTKILANVPAGFIGDGDTLFTMANGYIERRYNSTTDRITYDVHGDMTAKAIKVDVLTFATVASDKWLLGLTSNMDIIASEGTTTLQYGYMILPDTRIVVEKDAKVVIDPAARVHIWRLDDWQKGFVGGPSNASKTLVPIRYTVANGTKQVRTALSHSGALINNGTVTAYSNVFTTNGVPVVEGSTVVDTLGGKADDMVIRGTGTLINNVNPNGTPSGTLNQLVKSSEWVTINTKPVLSYMYGENEVSSFETGTYYPQSPAVDTHGNGKYDSWYQWQVDYTLTDENGDTINYTDYAYNSDIDLDGTLIVDGKRYVITSMDSITDTSGNDLTGTITYDGNVTKGGVAVNKNAKIEDGWEFIQFHNLNQDIKVALRVQSYDHRVVWTVPAADKTKAVYITGNTASYAWDRNIAVSATVTPAGGATATPVYGTTTTLNLTNITEDVEVSMTENYDSCPVSVNVTYPDGTKGTATIFSTQDANGVWTATYAPEKPAEGWYVIESASIENSTVAACQNNNDSLTVTGVNTGGVVVNVTLAQKDYKITYNTSASTLAPSFVNSGETVSLVNTALGDGYIFGDAVIATTPTTSVLTVTPTNLTLTGIDKDLTVNVPVIAYNHVVTADGQTAYVTDGGEVTFTLEAGYAINGASIPSDQVGTVTYTNPANPSGCATITVSDVRSDIAVTVDKVHFDAVVNFKDADGNVLATKYYGEGNTITYTAIDEGAGSGRRFYVAGATSTGATVTNTTQTVTVTDVTGSSADIKVALIPFTYKVTWNDGVETTYTYLTGTESTATYTAPDERVGGKRYIIQTGYGQNDDGATNTYSFDKNHFTVTNVNADAVVTLTLKPFTYKVVFTDQNDKVLKTQYSDAEGHDVTIGVGDNTIRYNVAGQDLISQKKTIITSAKITAGTAIVNNGAAFGDGVQLVTLTGIGSDVTAKLEVYEYDYKVLVVLNDKNGWSSETETHYVAGSSYSWTKPAGAEYNLYRVSSTYGTASKSGDVVNLNLTGVSTDEVELDITTVRTEERLQYANFANHSNGVAEIEIEDKAYGLFTVSAGYADNGFPLACIVAIANPDGSFSRLIATHRTGNTYEFACPKDFNSDISIVVVIKGDFNGDGKVGAVDYVRVKAIVLGKVATAPTAIQLLSADLNADNALKAVDYVRVKAFVLGKNNSLSW